MNHLLKSSRTKIYAAFAVLAAFILTIVLVLTNTNIGSHLFPGRASQDDYHLILDEDNAVSSSGTVTQYTSSGHYGVEFTYTNVQAYENGHTRLNAGGTLVNKDQITSVTEISATFVTNGSLKFRASYDGATWGGYTSMVSGEHYELGTKPYYIEFSTDGANYVNIGSIQYDYSCVANPDAAGTVIPDDTVWQCVTSNSQLAAGDEVVLVGKYSTSYYYALRAEVQNNYYLYCDEITVNSGEETCEVTSQDTFILAAGSTSGTWTIKHGENYIRGYTSGTHKNVGVTTTYAAGECDWSFEFDGSVVSFYNPNNSLYLVYDYYNSKTDEFKAYSGTYTSYTHLLYKKVVTEAHTDYPTPIDCVGFEASNDWIGSYTTNNIFDESKNLDVKAVYNDGSKVALSQGGENGYSYYVKNSLGQTIDTSEKFPAEGVYTLVIEYKNYIPVEIQIVVGEYVYVEDVSAAMTKVSYNTADVLGTQLEGNLTANIEWSNNTTDSNIAYSEFAAHGLSAKLMNISGIAYDMSKPFGTAGTWTLRVYATGNEQLYYDISLTVAAIPVTSVTIDGDSTINIEVDGTAQLTVTVGPENATNPSVTWASGNEAVATVEDGKVTGVSVGTTIITATSRDGTNKYGSVNVNVTEKTSVEDTITASDLTATGSSYLDFSGVSKSSGAVYAGNSAKNGTAIQLRSKSSNSGIVSTTSGGKIKTVTISWASTTTTTRYVDIYASHTAYDDATDLYGGSKVDALEWPGSATSQTYTFTSDYEYVGIRSRDGALYLDSVKFGWGGSGGSTPTPTPDPVYPTSISVSGNNALTVGDTSQLSVSYSSGTTVMNTTYSSSNTSVATVSPTGLVTAVAQGSAVITASAESDGNGNHVTATITITVSPVSVTSVSLDSNSVSIKTGKTTTLVATVYPTNATNKSINWSSSDTSVATVSGGVVTGVAAGTAIITVTTVDGSKTATCTVTVTAAASGGEETHSITYSDLSSGSYPTSVTSYTSSTGFTFQAYYCANFSSKMQFKASQGYIQSTEEMTLQSITINGRESNSLTVYGSNTAGSFSTEISGDNDVYDLTGYSYFKVARTSSGAAYCSSITILTGTPTPTDPTGLIMSQTTAEVRVGGTAQLSVSYVPSNANQHKNVSWTSSNTSVATVDSTGLVSVKSTATAGQTSTITARLSDSGYTTIYATCTITVVEQSKDDHTVLIYICGSNLESDYASSNEGLATGDIEEILNVSGQPDDVNIVIQTGGANKWSSTYGITATKNQRYHVENRQLVKDVDAVYSSYTSMGVSSTLQSFIEYGLNNFPAERTGLVLWNHGGAMRGVCYDEKKSDDNLSTTEVASAVSGALSNCGMSGQKLEWIGYDACLMQVQDIASINADYFNYMIASEESEAGYGWDYDTWVDDLYAKKTTPVILKAIVDGFIKDNGGTSSSSNDQTLSYLNLSKMSAYLTAWNNMSSQLANKITSSNKSSFNSLVTSCKHYADDDYTYYGTFDAKDFVNKLSSNSTFNPGSTYTSAVLDAFSDLVAYSSCGKGAGNSYGLCLFWSCSSNCQKGTYYTASMTKFTAWRSLVTTYGS